MRLLVIGGGAFVGRHVVEAAVGQGHEVWLANRGRTSTDTFGGAGRFTIDRADDDLGALEGERFDAALDVSAYVPRHVTALHDVIGESVDRYLLVSTVSVYDAQAIDGQEGEDAPLASPVRDTEEVSNETYGGLKVACEEDAAARWGDRLTVVRPGIVAGPHDGTDRFTWWVRTLDTAGGVALPDRRDQAVQVVDARDLGAFCTRLVEEGTSGTFDATGEVLDLAGLAAAVVEGLDSTPDVDWTDPAGWSEGGLPPLVLPVGVGDDLFRRRSRAAEAAGLTRRPVAETAADTRAWDVERGEPALKTGP